MKLFSDNSHSFPWFKCFKAFHTFQQTLPLFTFVYVCLPLFTFVNLCLPVFNWRIYACFLYIWRTDRQTEDQKTNKQVDRPTGRPTVRKTDRELGRHRHRNSSEFGVYKLPTTSWLPQSSFYPWESAPRVNILILGTGSQGQDFDLGSRLPG